MSKSNHAPGPVPPGNRPHAGTGNTPPAEPDADTGPSADQERDPKGRHGGYTGKGEAPVVQPGRANDGA